MNDDKPDRPRRLSTAERRTLALGNLNAAYADLTAAHGHVVAAASGLDNARHVRATQLGELIADALVFTRRLAMVVEGDLRADETEQ